MSARLNNPNIEILEIAVRQLGDLADELVFLGGCATGLLITDPGASPIRATQDVDAITEVGSWVDYHRLSEKLRERGFSEDTSKDAPICRWKGSGILLDVMPTKSHVLGFANEWYPPAFEKAESLTLPSRKQIRMVTSPYFLATKIAAFDSRGENDYLMSHDMEDIVAVLDGRADVVEEIRTADKAVREYLMRRLTNLQRDNNFTD